MEHSTWIKSVTCNTFKIEFVSFHSFFKDDFILRICGILSKNDFTLNDISLGEFKCFNNIVFSAVNCWPCTSIGTDHVVTMERTFEIKSIIAISCCFRVTHSYCNPVIGWFKDFEWEFFRLLEIFLQRFIQ